MSTHQAATLLEKGTPLEITERQTPTLGPNELLIEVHAAALNPVDHFQRDLGMFVREFPAILGSDVSGIVAKAGSDVRPDTPKPGTRVTAFASSWFNGKADYGALQKYVIVSEDIVSVLPDSYSFVEGSVFPMAALTSWCGWLWAGISPSSPPSQKEGVFVWGASSSMGTFAVQEAKLMGYTVYATAGAQHHEYIKGLGAARVFDYKNEDILGQMVNSAKEDGITVRAGYLATGDQQLAIDVLAALSGGEKAKLAVAPILKKDLTLPEGIEAAFVSHPEDPVELKGRIRWVFRDWLEARLAAKELVASPHIKVVKGGLAAVNWALDELKGGVSCSKLVVEL
ncbi:zinc-binding oxidoreductase-like protein CipB [Penicillium argentinense]|uniref:Zinc-binding oxidoreductase-like protein CipB n=1 Tax=Penicillium argentinense TaxID=1131581 RepID=A0A9W9KAW6_9EURO|nr:zinc-binding oxidoreductase-like protein CipB [Penicillium argentinense]KAJ5099480.1 zinc-binding oxidoreductase-like protein CipB [Penicillium argentinense]